MRDLLRIKDEINKSFPPSKMPKISRAGTTRDSGLLENEAVIVLKLQ